MSINIAIKSFASWRLAYFPSFPPLNAIQNKKTKQKKQKQKALYLINRIF